MPSPGALAAFLAAASVLVVIPGPSVLFIVGRSIAHGRTVGVLSVAGCDLGLLVLALSAAFGVGALIQASQAAYWAIKIGGALYLIYLGVQAIRHRKRAGDAAPCPGPGTGPGTRPGARPGTGPHSRRGVLTRSFLVGVTNPKTLAISTALFPQFADPARGLVPLQLAVFGVLFWGMALVSDSAWAVGAGTARDWFARSPRRREQLSVAGGAMMIALGGALAAARRASASRPSRPSRPSWPG